SPYTGTPPPAKGRVGLPCRGPTPAVLGGRPPIRGGARPGHHGTQTGRGGGTPERGAAPAGGPRLPPGHLRSRPRHRDVLLVPRGARDPRLGGGEAPDPERVRGPAASGGPGADRRRDPPRPRPGGRRHIRRGAAYHSP